MHDTPPTSSTSSPCTSELDALHSQSLQQLRTQWKTRFGANAPAHMRSSTLVKALAYALQAQSQGDLPAGMQRELRALAKPMVERPRLDAIQALQPGTRLLRHWRGDLHEVIVRETGFEWRSESYPSLSRIAREITGTRWNGPRFFGLREAIKTQAHANG